MKKGKLFFGIAIIILLIVLQPNNFNRIKGFLLKNSISDQLGITKVIKNNSLVTDNADSTALDSLPFQNKRQLELSELDTLGRATGAHIQLKETDEPTEKRAAKLNYNPSGWHNYKFAYDGDKKGWLMSRGHLIGYQFSGLNDEPKNLITETTWMNAGNYVGMNAGNVEAMLYYENRLDSWLATHPNYYLDYQVRPIYKDSELVARQVVLAYVGIDSSGNKLEIKLGGGKEQINQNGLAVVYLENSAPNAMIDYATGIAVQK
ncbi:DNAse [Bacilli bacterium]|nr:DNAse [Bacilli bacterium]